MMLPTTGDGFFAAVSAATCRAFREAEIRLPPDVVAALRSAADKETSHVARREFEHILENLRLAEELCVPICQDTGVPVVYLTIPPFIPVSQELLAAVADGVRVATREIPLRPNVVSPLDRINSGDNCGEGMPAVHIRPGERLLITVLPKGAGAENMSRLSNAPAGRTGPYSRLCGRDHADCRWPPLSPGGAWCWNRWNL